LDFCNYTKNIFVAYKRDTTDNQIDIFFKTFSLRGRSVHPNLYKKINRKVCKNEKKEKRNKETEIVDSKKEIYKERRNESIVWFAYKLLRFLQKSPAGRQSDARLFVIP